MVKQLYDYAKGLGVQIEYANLASKNRVGEYDLPTRTIYLQPGMLYRKERSTLAHELAHATFNDEVTMFEHINDRQERRADEWAAHFLIDEREYRIAEAKYGVHLDWIAQELGVLTKLVVAYERTMSRVGDTIYVSPRLGRGQWARRISA